MARLQRRLCSLFCLVPRRVLRKLKLFWWPCRGSKPHPVPPLSRPQGQSREKAPGATIPSLLWAATTYVSRVLGNSGFVSPRNLISPMRASVATRFPGFILFIRKDHLLGIVEKRSSRPCVLTKPLLPQHQVSCISSPTGQTAKGFCSSPPLLASVVTCALRINGQFASR